MTEEIEQYVDLIEKQDEGRKKIDCAVAILEYYRMFGQFPSRELCESKWGTELTDKVLGRTGLDFGDVIKALKKDPTKRFARKGWNGKGIYIMIQNPDEHSRMSLPYIYIVTSELQSDNTYAPRGIVPWLASQTDMLAEDWIEVEG